MACILLDGSWIGKVLVLMDYGMAVSPMIGQSIISITVIYGEVKMDNILDKMRDKCKNIPLRVEGYRSVVLRLEDDAIMIRAWDNIQDYRLSITLMSDGGMILYRGNPSNITIGYGLVIFSNGMKKILDKRGDIVRVILNNPEVIKMDEIMDNMIIKLMGGV